MFFFLAVDTLQMGSSARMRGDPILWGDTSIQMARMAQLSSHGPDPSLSGKLFYSLPCGEPPVEVIKSSHIFGCQPNSNSYILERRIKRSH